VDPFAADTHQIADNNPGITSSGLLWTIPAPRSAVDVDLDAGTARYRMSNVAMANYGTLANALAGGGDFGIPGPSTPSTVSWDLRFSGVTSRGTSSDSGVGFILEYQNTGAHLDWSMRSATFNFDTNPSGQTALVAFIGHERNGSFFR
jgi:hypothetical protein